MQRPDSRQRTYWVFVALALLCGARAFAEGNASFGWIVAAAVAAIVAWKLRASIHGGDDDGYVSLRDSGVPLPPQAGVAASPGPATMTDARHAPPPLPAAWTQPPTPWPPAVAPPLPPPRRERLGIRRGQAFVVILVALLIYVIGLMVVSSGPGYPAVSPPGLAFAAVPYAVLMLALSRSGVGNPALVLGALAFTVFGLFSVATATSWEGRQFAAVITGSMQLVAAMVVVIAVAVGRR